MKAIRVTAEIIGSGIDYRKRVSGISQKSKRIMKDFFGLRDICFYCKKPGVRHYTQSGFKVIIYNPGRFEFYHREPDTDQLIAILKNERREKHAKKN